jgi:hypothetical protein
MGIYHLLKLSVFNVSSIIEDSESGDSMKYHKYPQTCD